LNFLPAEDDLPEGVKLKPLPKNGNISYGIDANPYFSTEQQFIKALTDDLFSKQFVVGKINSAVCVVYDNDKKMGVFGFQFDTLESATEASSLIEEKVIRGVNAYRMTLHQKNKQVIVIWTDGSMQNQNYKAFVKLIKKM
jgi:hypothetical protein